MDYDWQIDSSVEFIKELWQDQKDMQDTINTDHPNFEGSDEHECFRNHEINMMRLEIIRKQLLLLKENPFFLRQKVQIPEG